MVTRPGGPRAPPGSTSPLHQATLRSVNYDAGAGPLPALRCAEQRERSEEGVSGVWRKSPTLTQVGWSGLCAAGAGGGLGLRGSRMVTNGDGPRAPGTGPASSSATAATTPTLHC